MAIVENTANNKYLQVRQKALSLENEIEEGEKKCKEEILLYIQKIQTEYYKKYGLKIEELQDLIDAIEQYKNKGYRQLKKEIQNIHMYDMNNDSLSYEEKQKLLKEKSKKLYDNFTLKYTPQDDFQIKRDKEALKLQNSILSCIKEF